MSALELGVTANQNSIPRELVYDVPDSFNGTLRVMAVAVAPEAMAAFALASGDDPEGELRRMIPQTS